MPWGHGVRFVMAAAAGPAGFTPEPVSRGALPPIVTIKVSLVGESVIYNIVLD